MTRVFGGAGRCCVCVVVCVCVCVCVRVGGSVTDTLVEAPVECTMCVRVHVCRTMISVRWI